MESQDNLRQMLTKKPHTVSNPTPIKTGSPVPIPIVAATTQQQTKQEQPAQPEQPIKKPAGKDTQVFVKLPEVLDEYIRDFQYAEVFRTGNFKFSYKDALCAIIEFHKAANPDTLPRPLIVRENEKKSKK